MTCCGFQPVSLSVECVRYAAVVCVQRMEIAQNLLPAGQKVPDTSHTVTLKVYIDCFSCSSVTLVLQLFKVERNSSQMNIPRLNLIIRLCLRHLLKQQCDEVVYSWPWMNFVVLFSYAAWHKCSGKTQLKHHTDEATYSKIFKQFSAHRNRRCVHILGITNQQSITIENVSAGKLKSHLHLNVWNTSFMIFHLRIRLLMCGHIH